MRLGESCPHLFGPSFCHIKCSPDFTNIMTECPLANKVTFPLPGQEFVRDYASHHAVKGKQVLNRLLVLLSPHLESQLSTSCTSRFSPAFLLSICDVLQVDSSAEQDDTSALPFVLGKLRDWRLLDPNYRYSSAGVHKLALDLARIADEASALTSSDFSRTSQGRRLRMKWVGLLDPPSEILPPESTSPASLPSWSALDSAQKCAHVLVRCRSDAARESCQVSRLGTPDSEDSSAVGSRRCHAVSGFRSGCSACRHPRVSGASTPPSPLMTSVGRRTPFGDANQFDTRASTSVVLSRHSKVTEQRATAKKPKKESNTFLQSIPRGMHVDENEPPLGLTNQGGLGISFPRQRTHPPRISNTSSSRAPYSPAATCSQRRVEPSRLSNRTREGDKRMSSHRVASTSVDLVLPIARVVHSPSTASPIDLHRQPNRAQSFSCTSHASGSVARNPKLSSNAVSRSGKLLPFWSQTDASSASPAKARSQHAQSRPWIPSSIPSDARGASRLPVSSHTHRHTQSAGSALPSPRLAARKWQA